MKSYLMFEDRDFDPSGILISRERKFRPEDKPNLDQLLPWNHQDLIKDLGLGFLFDAMAEDNEFLFETIKVSLLSVLQNVDSVLYRQNILKDCIKNEKIVRDIYQLTIETIKKEKDILGWGLLYQTPDSVLYQSRSKLEMFLEMLQRLRIIIDLNENNFDSIGFNKLFGTLKEELNDEYMEEVKYNLNELIFKDGILVSAALGFGNKGTNYILHKPPKDSRNWFEKLLSKELPGYTFELHPRDEAGARALSELRNQSINIVANALAQSMDHILSFFQALRTELAFYIGCLNLNNKLMQMNEPVCFPKPLKLGEKSLLFSELYDINLTLSSGRKVVGNDLTADNKNLFIITGANTGGKSTFLRSIGIAQLMMQAGMFVPAKSFSSEIRERIFTHFKREEDVEMGSGKLDEELSRMSEIVDNINPASIILLNESFAATNEKEGSEVARQITNALIESGIKVLFVTHQFEFANSFYEKEMRNSIFLRAERLPDGKRTFKIKEGKPMQTSYGEDLYDNIFLKKGDVRN